jgi:ureidoglycolate dehydrogenase (NAD+)
MNPDALQAFSRKLLEAAGSDAREAAVVAEILVWCDSVGRPNQGVWRLPILCERLSRGLFESPCRLQTEMKSKAIAIIDGGAGQGHFVAFRAMEQAIQLASDQGIAAVAVKNSNFYGAGGYYAAMAAQQNMIGLAVSNSFPKVRAAAGSRPVLGTNPLAFACPAREGEPLVLDMATSELAGSTVRRQQEAAVGNPAPGVLDPLGGHKGFGLALLVEILSGVLSGAGFSHQVKSMYNDFEHSGDNGHFFLAIDIETLMPLAAFRDRMSTLMGWLAASGEPGEVRYPGQNRWEALRKTSAEGIELDKATRMKLNELGERFGVCR